MIAESLRPYSELKEKHNLCLEPDFCPLRGDKMFNFSRKTFIRPCCATHLALVRGRRGATTRHPVSVFLAPITGPLATPGAEMLNGMKMFWEQNNYTAAGRKVELVIADTTCNPDQALTQGRRLALQDKVHFIIGPLCGHEGPADCSGQQRNRHPTDHGSGWR
jgi:hypothetical protein